MIDLALERDLERFFIHPVANEDQDTVLEMMRHPRAVVTFSDSGAHVSQIIDSSLQTHLLSHWVRAKQAFTLEQAVRMLTLVPATHWGFADRGLVREGFAADLIVFDPDTISPELPEVVNDLPAGARRLLQRARGIAATIVNGEVLRARLPARAERAGRAAGHRAGGATGDRAVALEASLNLAEMCQAALDVRAVSSLPVLLDAADGEGRLAHLGQVEIGLEGDLLV